MPLKVMSIALMVYPLCVFQIYFRMDQWGQILHTMMSKIRTRYTYSMMGLLYLLCLVQQQEKCLYSVMKKVKNTIKINE